MFIAFLLLICLEDLFGSTMETNKKLISFVTDKGKLS